MISLAKVQVKPLADSGGERGGRGGRYMFEIWSMSKIWRYAAPSEVDRERWVSQLQAQVRCGLLCFHLPSPTSSLVPPLCKRLPRQSLSLRLPFSLPPTICACSRGQVRWLLASFKQRGKSLAFLPQNVQLLRQQLRALQQEKQTVERRVGMHRHRHTPHAQALA